MANRNDDSLVCPHCNADVQADDDFCPACGEVFVDNLECSRHGTNPAVGICVVCTQAFCSDCGSRVQDRFLCRRHETLEIYEGMVRVFGSNDAVQVEFAKSSLEMEGFHPLVFSRKASPISLGAPDYTLFRASGEYDGHIVNEFKLMVPCQEVLQAQEVLRELKFIDP